MRIAPKASLPGTFFPFVSRCPGHVGRMENSCGCVTSLHFPFEALSVVKLAILHQTLPICMEHDPPEESRHLEVMPRTSDPDRFRKGLQDLRPRVLVLDLPLPGSSPESEVKALEEAVKPELTMIVHAFAKWDLIEALRGPRKACAAGNDQRAHRAPT
jgi:hypothetical protein